MNIEKTVHQNLFLKLTALMIDDKLSVLELGDKLTALGADDIVTGGFWIMDCNSQTEYYSPNFRASLDYKGEQDFPSVRDSWRDLLSEEELKLADYNFSEYLKTDGDHPYYQEVTYPKKNGGTVKVVCSGTVKYDSEGNPEKVFGTHKIIK